MSSGPPSYRGVSPPPAYESRAGSLHGGSSPPPDSTIRHQTRQQEDTTEEDREGDILPPDEHENKDAGASTGKRRLSFIRNATQAYKEKRLTKEAARKVDYYEKL